MKYLLLVLVLLSVAGCMTYADVLLDEIPTVIDEGDHVRITTAAGETGKYLIEGIESDALIVVPIVDSVRGVSVRMPLTNISRLESRRLSVARGGAAVGGLFLLVLIVGFVGFATSGGGAVMP